MQSVFQDLSHLSTTACLNTFFLFWGYNRQCFGAAAGSVFVGAHGCVGGSIWCQGLDAGVHLKGKYSIAEPQPWLT